MGGIRTHNVSGDRQVLILPLVQIQLLAICISYFGYMGFPFLVSMFLFRIAGFELTTLAEIGRY
jgi:hypothetical protein